MRNLARVVVAAVAGVLLVLGACLVLVEVGVPLGGISRSQATQMANEQLNTTSPAQVAWAIPGPFALFRGGTTDAVAPGSRLVWAVGFSGTFPPASCGPAPIDGGQPHCPAPAHTAMVILDYRTGTFIMGSYGP